MDFTFAISRRPTNAPLGITLAVPPGELETALWHPSGNRILTIHRTPGETGWQWKGTFRMLDGNGQPLPGQDPQTVPGLKTLSCAYSPDGRWLAWSASEHRPNGNHNEVVRGFLQDGRGETRSFLIHERCDFVNQLLFGHGGRFLFWTRAFRKEAIHAYDLQRSKPCADLVLGWNITEQAVLHPSENQLAWTGGGCVHRITFMESQDGFLATKETHKESPVEDGAICLFDPTGRWLFVGGSGLAAIDPHGQRLPIPPLPCLRERTQRIAHHPERRLLAVRTTNHVCVWEYQEHERYAARVWEIRSDFSLLSFSPDGSKLLCETNGGGGRLIATSDLL